MADRKVQIILDHIKKLISKHYEEVAAIITVYEPDPAKWIDFTKRR